MKWPLPLLLGYLLLALESPVREALRLGATASSPSLVFPLVVFVALMGSNGAALWTGLLMGLAVDLTTQRTSGGILIAGPHALGYVAAAYLILTLRPMLMRKNPITLVMLSMVGEWLSSVVVVAVFTVRATIYRGSWADGLGHSMIGELWQRIIGGCYTGLVAIVLAALFFWLLPLFGFHDQSTRRSFTRRR